MKNIADTLTLSCFACLFLWIFLLLIPKPSWAAGNCIENKTYSVNGQAARTTSVEEAVGIAKEYLNIESTINYEIKIEEKIITTDAYNTYKVLEPGINKLCWVVTIIAPKAVGASRTVYVNKESGEILGGYSSK